MPAFRVGADISSLLITAGRSCLEPAKWLEDMLQRILTATMANLHELVTGNGKLATA